MESPFVQLPLRVEDGAMYWQRRRIRSSSSDAVEEEVEEEVCFWRRDQTSYLFPVEDPAWKGLASELLEEAPREDNGRDGQSALLLSSSATTNLQIRADRLAEIVARSGGNGEVALHVAALTNAHRPPLKNPRTAPEMLYQHLVFPPVSVLFYSFDPDQYCAAHSRVDSGIFTYKDARGDWVHLKGLKPDAAVMLSSSHLVLAMLELKKDGMDHDDDSMHKCVLMSSVSALALVREGGVTKVTIPFVVHNGGEWANLFTLTVERDGERESCPVVRKLFVADMSDPTKRAALVAYLAVILHKLTADILANDNLRALRENLSSISC